MSTATNSSAAAVKINHSSITPSSIESSPLPDAHHPRLGHNILPESQGKLASKSLRGAGRLWIPLPDVVGGGRSPLRRCVSASLRNLSYRPGHRATDRSLPQRLCPPP